MRQQSSHESGLSY